MLQTIRDRAQGWIAWVIVTLISVPFALWGIQEYLGVGGEPTAAEVDGVEITQRQLDGSVDRYRSRLREQFGGKLPDMFSDEMLRAQVLNSMIQEQLLVQHAIKAGLRAGDEMVRADIRKVPSFQRNGKFDSEEYRRILAIQGQSPAYFEEQMRQSMATDLLSGGIADSAVVTDAGMNEYVRLKNQKRTVSYVTVEANAFADQVSVSDEEITAYYGENEAQFHAPERVKIEYIQINAETVATAVPLDEASLRAYYDENKSAYTSEERRSVRHILVAADESKDADVKAKAQKLLDELNGGADFAELAKQNSDDPGSGASGGDLGVVERGVMVKPFEESAFALKEGEMSGLVRTRFGYHIIQVTAIEGGETKSFDEVKDEIAKQNQQAEVQKQLYDKAERIAELAYDTPDTLQPASDALGIALQEAWVQRTGGSSELETAAVIESAFSEDVLERGYNSEPIELGSAENIVVFRVVEHQEAMPRPLEEVKDVIAELLKKQGMEKLASDKADALLASLTSDGSLADVATAHSLKLDEATEIGRSGSSLPPSVVDQAYRLAIPASGSTSFGKVSMATGNQVIVGVSNVVDGDAASLSESERTAVKSRLAAARGNAEFSGFVAWLRETGKVAITKKSGE